MQKLKGHLKHHALMFSIFLCAFTLDLITKSWANASLQPHVRSAFIPQLLNFVLVNNSGLAFSMVNENGFLAKAIATAVFVILLYFYIDRYVLKEGAHPLLEKLGVATILGAAAGNLLERFVSGHVTDFLEFAFVSFPVFNLADVLIDVGVGLVFISIFRTQK